MINYAPFTPNTVIIYPKTALTQEMICDSTRSGNAIHVRNYHVCIGHELCVWQPLGPGWASQDGTVMGMMELRSVVDGKLCAVLGSERRGEGDEPHTKRRVMVRGEWAPGLEVSDPSFPSLSRHGALCVS